MTRVLEFVRERGNNVGSYGYGRGLWAYIGAANGYRLDTVPEGSPLVGWRAWACSPNGELCSITKVWPWAQQGRAAQCMGANTRTHLIELRRRFSYVGSGVDLDVLDEHGVSPSPECGCGYWAFREEMTGGSELRQMREWARGRNSFFVTGGVELWGRVVSHEHGFRAEFARPVGTLVVSSIGYKLAVNDFLVGQLEARYGLTVVSKRD